MRVVAEILFDTLLAPGVLGATLLLSGALMSGLCGQVAERFPR